MSFALITNALVPPYDEGIKKFTFHISNIIEKKDIPVYTITNDQPYLFKKLLLSKSFTSRVKQDKIHTFIYIPTQSASIGSLVRSTVLKRITGAKVILIAMQSIKNYPVPLTVIRRIAPDLILTPSLDEYEFLTKIDVRSELLPMGIDYERFTPPSPELKKSLRDKYGIPADDYVCLHVGHLQPLRNLNWIIHVVDNLNLFGLIVGSESMKADPNVLAELNSSRVFIINDYLPQIEEIYQLADCYLFPVLDNQASIGMPLSVLEAMACNLPVVTTPFGGLPKYFTPGDGLFYASDKADFQGRIEDACKLSPSDIHSRMRIIPYSWENLATVIIDKVETIWNPV